MTGRKRIAFVTEEVSLGSIVYSNVKFAQRLIDLGHEVDFVGIKDVVEDHRAQYPAEVKCFALGTDRVREGPLAFARYAKDRRPDAIFASCHLQALICAAGVRLLPYKPRLIVKSHISTEVLLSTQTTFFDRKLLVHALRLIAPRGTRFIAVSDEGARDFERAMGTPRGFVETLYDPVLPPANREFGQFRHPWLEGAEDNLVLSVGRLHPQKDYPLLLRAFALARARRADLRLMILGDGDERQALEVLAAELGIAGAVAMPGFADPGEAYRRASLFVCSSAYEGLCNVIIEALDAGCKVVSTDCPVGPAEVLENGKHGLLVPVGDAEALAGAMLAALDSPGTPEAGRRRAMDFHIDSVWPVFAELAGIAPQPSTSSA